MYIQLIPILILHYSASQNSSIPELNSKTLFKIHLIKVDQISYS